MSEYKEAIEKMNPCNHDDGESYINMVIHYTMDGLHLEYYLINNFDYDLLFDVILDMFYVDLTEMYHNKKQRC